MDIINFILRCSCVICGYIVWRMSFEGEHLDTTPQDIAVRIFFGFSAALCAAAGVTLGV